MEGLIHGGAYFRNFTVTSPTRKAEKMFCSAEDVSACGRHTPKHPAAPEKKPLNKNIKNSKFMTSQKNEIIKDLLVTCRLYKIALCDRKWTCPYVTIGLLSRVFRKD